jgi:uncharacterized protein
VDDHDDFRGSGWRFPVLPSAGGGLAYVSGDDNVIQNTRLLLEIVCGEHPRRPTLGTTVVASLFDSDADPNDADQNLHEVEASVREAIQRHEPRVTVDGVEARRVDGPDGVVEVEVAVRIRRTNLVRNLVFPFYVQQATSP